MPKVFLREQDKLNDRVYGWIVGQLKVKGISQSVVAERIGISQQLFSYRLNKKILQISDFIAIISLVQPDLEELNFMLGVKGNGLVNN